MKLKLKEEPREWLKFTAVMAVVVAIVTYLLHRKGIISRELLLVMGAGLVVVLSVCSIWPHWFRGFYRGGMTVSFHFGQVIGKVLLTLLFLLMVTPLGLVLRLCGKDLLELKRKPAATTYWCPARKGTRFDRLF